MLIAFSLCNHNKQKVLVFNKKPPSGEQKEGFPEKQEMLSLGYFMQHFLYFLPLPQGQSSFRPIFPELIGCEILLEGVKSL